MQLLILYYLRVVMNSLLFALLIWLFLQDSPSKTASLPRSALSGRRFSAFPPSLAVSGRLEVRYVDISIFLSFTVLIAFCL